jgi:hypothetical protein
MRVFTGAILAAPRLFPTLAVGESMKPLAALARRAATVHFLNGHLSLSWISGVRI